MNRGLLLLCVVLTVSCSGATRQVPRLEQYDFLGDTPTELAVLRQMSTAEGPEGPVAQYALARAHAEWLVLGLVRDRTDDALLRRLAADLDIEGVTPDDRLNIEQMQATFTTVIAEVEAAAGAGGDARQWSGDMERLLEGLRAGWETFSPDLFHAVERVTERGGPVQPAADLLAVGWGRLVLAASTERPVHERAALILRMAGYYDPTVVGALDEHGNDLLAAGVDVTCPDLARSARGLSQPELLRLVRQECSPEQYGLEDDDRAWVTPELIAVAQVLGDLQRRRARLAQVQGDPMIQAARGTLRRFDELVESYRLPLPLPTPGPVFPDVTTVDAPAGWQITGAVVAVNAEGVARALVWPVLAAGTRGVRLLDGELPRRVETFSEELRLAWRGSRHRLGMTERSVALAVDPALPLDRLGPVLAECVEAGAESMSLVVAPDATRLDLALIPIELSPGAARLRSAADRRVVLILGGDSVQVADADSRWVEVQDMDERLADPQVRIALEDHLRGRGNRSCIISLRPEASAARLGALLSVMGHHRADGEGWDWRVELDPEDPPTSQPVASTVPEALNIHRVQLRECYERFLRDGGEGQGLVVMEVSIRPDGRVGEARVLRTEIGPRPVLDTCLRDVLRRITFPEDTVERTVHVPLRLVPRSQ